jgi:hypothetical protein
LIISLPRNSRQYVESLPNSFTFRWKDVCFGLATYLLSVYPYHFDGMWRVGLPDGDYAIFLAEDFSFGFFGHPWEATICIFGEPLLEAFQKYPPRLFEKVVRKDGKPV